MNLEFRERLGGREKFRGFFGSLWWLNYEVG